MADGAEVAGIGLSGQMHSLVMLDENDNVIRPAILWCDQRSAPQCEELEQLVGKERLRLISANPPVAGFTASKILWVQRNEPENWQRCRHILLPKDYIRFRLTGVLATDVTDASGMQLMDVSERKWSSELIEKLSIPREYLADIYESSQICGYVNAEAAKLTGLCEGVPVVGGAADNAAAAVGTGVVSPGDAFTTLGTSGVIYSVSDKPCIDEKGRVHTLCAPAPGMWTVMSCTQAAGLSLRWMRDEFCKEECQQALSQGKDPYEIMCDAAEKVAPGSEKLIYLPYLMGERSPHMDGDCRGVFFGLSGLHTRAHCIRAVLEGVAFSQKECLDVFAEMGVGFDKMYMVGGGARSPLWRSILADVYGAPVTTVKNTEGPALGAAILAAVGTGAYTDLEQACKALVLPDSVTDFDSARHGEYMPYFRQYKNIYSALKDQFKALSEI